MKVVYYCQDCGKKIPAGVLVCPHCEFELDWCFIAENCAGIGDPDWQLYTKMRGDVPVAYRYGPEWQATALMIDGGYKTPEEAKLAWLREWESQK